MANPLAVLTVAVTADTRALVTGMNAAVGAVGLLAGAAIKSAADYDKAFTRISAISNASAEDVSAWRGEVLALSGETARAPTELADALFFLSSAGLDAAQIMPTLEMAAKASAVGLGETADVANILASALNAYADSGLTAAAATDVLVAAVREGRAEPEEFAGALGRILPIASTIGVTFDQVAASLASLSNIGLDVNEGVTAMRGVFQALAAPGKQAAEAMGSVGISAQQMLDVIAEDGIIGALRLLDREVKANTTGTAEYNNVMRQIVPNVRSLTGVFGLTVQEASKVGAIFDSVRDSTGSLDEAFKLTAQSASFALDRSLNDVRIRLTEIGGRALPGLVDSLEAVAPLLDTIARNIDLVVAGLIAMKAATTLGASAFVGLGRAAGPIVGIIVGAIAAGRELNEIFFGMDRSIEEVAEIVSTGLVPAFEKGLISFEQYNAAAIALKDANFGNVDALLEVAAAIEEEEERQRRAAAFRESASNAADDYTASLRGLVPEVVRYSHEVDNSTEASRRFANMGKKAFNEFVSDVGESLQIAIGDFENFNDAFATTPAELARQSRVAVAVARQMRADLREIFRSKDLSDAQKEALASLPADQRRAWAEAGNEAKAQIARDASKVAKANKDATALAARLANTSARSGGREIGSAIMSGVSTGIRDGAAAAAVAGEASVREIIARMKRAAQIASPSRLTAEIGAELINGLIAGMEKGLSPLAAAVDRVVDAVREHMSAIEELEKTSDAAKEALRVADQAAIDQLREFSRDISEVEGKFERLNARIDEFRDAIRSGFEQFDLVGGAIDVLNEFEEAQRSFAESAAERAEAVNAPASLVAPDLGDFLAGQAAEARELANVLRGLSRAGLNRDLLADLAGQGTAGIALGQELLANPELIREFNEAQREIAKALGSATEKIVAEEFGAEVRRLARDANDLGRQFRRFVGTLDSDLIPSLRKLSARIGEIVETLRVPEGGGGKNGPRSDGAANVGPGGGAANEIPPIRIVLDSGELVAYVDEGLQRRNRQQGRLAHNH